MSNPCTNGHRWVFSHVCDIYGAVGYCVDCCQYTMDGGMGNYDLTQLPPEDEVLSWSRVSIEEAQRLGKTPRKSKSLLARLWEKIR